MESTYSIDSQAHLVRLKVSGELPADRLIGLLQRAGADPQYVPGMSVLADYREAHGDWDYSEIQRLRDYVVQVSADHELRWAAVVSPGSLAAAGHLLIVISEAVGAKVKIQLFEDPQRALQWLEESS